MKQKLLFLLLALLPSAMAWAAVGDEFVYNGMKYTVTSESPKEVELTEYDGEMPTGTLTLISYVQGYNVTSIGDGAFESCVGLDKVVIPNGVRSIGECAFQSTAINSVTIPSTVTSIGAGAFANCHLLTSIDLPAGIKTIEPGTFSWCGKLTSVGIPEGVTSIGAQAFYDCGDLASVDIPSSVTTIGEWAFYSCSALRLVTIPAAVTSIGNGAFAYCEAMTDVYMRADPTQLAWDAEPVWSDATWQEYCQRLPDFKPDGSTKIHIDRGTDWSAFEYKANGQFVYDGLGVGDEFNDSKLRYKVTGLSPATVEVLGPVGTPSGTITINATVGQFAITSIGGDAFLGCTAVTDVYCYANPQALTWEDTGMNDFKPGKATSMHVPKSSNWSSFTGKLNVTIYNDLITAVGDGFQYNGLWYQVTNVKPREVELFHVGDNNPTGDLVIPAYADGWAVTRIASNTFTSCDGLTSVTIPETVTSIGRDAFYRCTGVTDVYCNADLNRLEWTESGRDDFKADGSTLCHVTDAEAWQTKFGATVNVTFVEKVVSVALNDATPYTQTTLTDATYATYTKTIGADRVGKHQAWMLPFDYTITEDDEDYFHFYRINMIANAAAPGEGSASGDMWVFLTKMSAGNVLHANMPYVYKPKTTVMDYAFTTENATLQPRKTEMLAKSETLQDIYKFYGTYEDTEATGADPFYYVNTNGGLSYGDNVTVGPFRWIIRRESKYGDEPGYVKEMHFVDGEEDDETGISLTPDLSPGRGEIYNLAGQMVNGKWVNGKWQDGKWQDGKLPKGIYIVSGKKILVK